MQTKIQQNNNNKQKENCEISQLFTSFSCDFPFSFAFSYASAELHIMMPNETNINITTVAAVAALVLEAKTTHIVMFAEFFLENETMAMR